MPFFHKITLERVIKLVEVCQESSNNWDLKLNRNDFDPQQHVDIRHLRKTRDTQLAEFERLVCGEFRTELITAENYIQHEQSILNNIVSSAREQLEGDFSQTIRTAIEDTNNLNHQVQEVLLKIEGVRNYMTNYRQAVRGEIQGFAIIPKVSQMLTELLTQLIKLNDLSKSVSSNMDVFITALSKQQENVATKIKNFQRLRVEREGNDDLETLLKKNQNFKEEHDKLHDCEKHLLEWLR
jgi:hypothetical protein